MTGLFNEASRTFPFHTDNVLNY